MTEMVDVNLIVPIKCSTIHKFFKYCGIGVVSVTLIFCEFMTIESILFLCSSSSINDIMGNGLIAIFFGFISIIFIYSIACNIFNVRISIDCIRNGG